MGKGPSAPAAPNYVAPPPYTSPPSYSSPGYTSPAPYVSPPDPNSTVPPVYDYQKILNQGARIETELPSWMNSFWYTNPLDTSSPNFQQYETNYSASNVAPIVAADQAALNASGQNYSSYGGALVSQDKAMGSLAAYQAALGYAQQNFQNQLAAQQAFFGGPITLAQGQNLANVQRGLGVAGLQSQNANNQNNYNLNSANMANQFNLGNSNSLNSYNLSANQGLNNYDLQGNQNQNQFSLGRYQGQLSAYNTQSQNYRNSLNMIPSFTFGLQ